MWHAFAPGVKTAPYSNMTRAYLLVRYQLSKAPSALVPTRCARATCRDAHEACALAVLVCSSTTPVLAPIHSCSVHCNTLSAPRDSHCVRCYHTSRSHATHIPPHGPTPHTFHLTVPRHAHSTSRSHATHIPPDGPTSRTFHLTVPRHAHSTSRPHLTHIPPHGPTSRTSHLTPPPHNDVTLDFGSTLPWGGPVGSGVPA